MTTFLKLSTVLFVVGLALTSSAAERPRHNLVVELRQPELTPGVASLALEVRAADIKEPVKAEIRRDKEGVSNGIYIPPGKGREIHVAGLDEKGGVLYEGVLRSDIDAKAPVSLVIPMSPRAGGELAAVSIASYSIKVEQKKGRKGQLLLHANVYDPDGNPAHLTPDDFNWGAYGPWPWDPDFQFPHKPDVKFPPDNTPIKVNLCPLGTTVVTVCFHNICKNHRMCADPVVSVSAGMFHTCALKSSGAVFCWGDNSDGQLGSPQKAGCGFLASDPDCTPAPTRITCPANSPCTFKQISAGKRHTCAIDTNEQLFCWGSNLSSQVGGPASNSVATPSLVMGSTIAVAAGDDFTCAITHNVGNRRQVKCWGANDMGQTAQPLRAPTNEQYPGPVIVRGDVPPVGVSTVTLLESKFILAGRAHACFVTLDGFMQCWGDNNMQQVSNGAPITVAPITGSPFPGNFNCGTCTITPVSVAGALFAGGIGSPLDLATAGGNTTCASFTGISTSCWGARPVTFNSTVDIKSIDAGFDHVCAVTATGTLCWGAGDWGQLGNGMFGNFLTPFAIPTPVSVLTTSTFTQVTAGGQHTCAVTTGGTVSCWGRNAEGQLGTGTFGSQVPTPVASLL